MSAPQIKIGEAPLPACCKKSALVVNYHSRTCSCGACKALFVFDVSKGWQSADAKPAK